jgi:hypothetical protein
MKFRKVTPLSLNNMKNKVHIIIVLSIGILLSCGKGDDDPEPMASVFPPNESVLIFPNNNEECNTGESVNENLSKVEFRWNASDNTTGYTIFVKNLFSDVENSFNTQNRGIELNISKNTPYKWWVISKSNTTQETAKSAEWKFYNSGDGTVTYAPFPAELVAPLMDAEISETTVTLEWKGSDVDDDIEEYEVFLDTELPPAKKLTPVSVEKVENEIVSPSTTYYWYVISKDSQGNTSTSQTFQFKVN